MHTVLTANAAGCLVLVFGGPNSDRCKPYMLQRKVIRVSSAPAYDVGNAAKQRPKHGLLTFVWVLRQR